MIADLFRAWKYGQELSDPAAWKVGAMLTTTVGGLVAAVIQIIKVKYTEFELPPLVEQYAVEAICSVLGIINVYVMKASSKKV
jgi:hypothetical protein